MDINLKRSFIGLFIIIFCFISYIYKLDFYAFIILIALILYDLIYSKLLNFRLILISIFLFMICFLSYFFFENFRVDYLNFIFLIILVASILLKNFFYKEIFVSILSLFLISIYFISINDRELVYLILVISFLNDTFAYVVGKNFKGPLIVSKISPNKTWSGTLSSFFFSLIILLLLDFTIFFSVFMSLSLFVGDIYFSYIKRSINIKDFSNSIPGHGGVLDRVDSMIFLTMIITFTIS